MLKINKIKRRGHRYPIDGVNDTPKDKDKDKDKDKV
jgi:hypothetical protein